MKGLKGPLLFFNFLIFLPIDSTKSTLASKAIKFDVSDEPVSQEDVGIRILNPLHIIVKTTTSTPIVIATPTPILMTTPTPIILTTPTPPNEGNCQLVTDTLSHSHPSVTVLKCQEIKEFDTVLRLMNNSSIEALELSQSYFKTLNLSQLIGFGNLERISVVNSKVSEILGTMPSNIKNLNLSSNSIPSIPSSLFQFQAPEKTISSSSSTSSSSSSSSITFIHDDNHNKRTKVKNPKNKEFQIGTSTPNSILKLEFLDLSFNKISELPKSIFHLPKLKSLLLAGNNLKGEFVWEKLWEWANESILKDADDTFCQFKEQGSYKTYRYSLLGVLKAKKDLEETCAKVDKRECGSCVLHALQRDLKSKESPISHAGKHGTISISLALDCSNKNLSRLPRIPKATWWLNVSNNGIRDLSPLKDPIYANLVYLDLDNNRIQIETLLGAPFLQNYITLSLRNNYIYTIPMQILKSMKSVQDVDDRRRGTTYLGANYLQCDCDAEMQIKPFLQRYSKKIIDSSEIYCRNVYLPDGLGHRSLKDLGNGDVCPIPRISETDTEVWIYSLILLETILILGIVAKVWYDQHRFRKTGILPWCSKKMPRLPCDTILEGFKEPNNLSTNNPSKKSTKSILVIPKTSRSGSDSSTSTHKSASGGGDMSKTDIKATAHAISKSQPSCV